MIEKKYKQLRNLVCAKMKEYILNIQDDLADMKEKLNNLNEIKKAVRNMEIYNKEEDFFKCVKNFNDNIDGDIYDKFDEGEIIDIVKNRIKESVRQKRTLDIKSLNLINDGGDTL